MTTWTHLLLIQDLCEALNVVVLRGGWPGICDRREVILGHKLMCYQVYVW